MNGIILEQQASDEDLILTAQQLKKSLKCLRNDGFCKNILPRDIEFDIDNGGWTFAEYIINSEDDKIEVEKYLEYCRRLISSTIFRGELSHNIINNKSGILYLFPENTSYTSNDMEYYKSAFGVMESYAEKYHIVILEKNIDNIEFLNTNSQKAVKYIKRHNIIDSKYLKYYDGEIIIDKNKDTVIGYVFVGNNKSKDEGFIVNLWVNRSYRRNGLGSKLLKDAVKKYNGIDLIVSKNNENAIKLYKAYGFVPIEYHDTGSDTYYWMKLKTKLKKDDIVIKESNSTDRYPNLTNFTWYHAEIERDGFNPKKAGGWDEELYSKNINMCIHNDIEYDYHFKGKDKTSAYLYTAGEELSPVYLGKITVYRTNKGVDWEWEEQEPISMKTVEYLKNKVQKNLLEDADLDDIEEWAPSGFVSRRSKPVKNQKAHKNYLKIKSRGKTNDATDQKVMPRFNQIGEEALTSTQRNGLDDNDFGIPELRKYPIHDKKHVEQAVKMFNHVDKEYEKQLAKRLLKAMKKFGVSTDSVGEKNRLKSYISETFIYETGTSRKRIKPIFIINSFTNTLFGKAISTYTHNKYSHSAISFDTSLETLYSFNADNQSNRFGGISIESISGYIDKYEDASIQVNCIFVKESDYDIIQNAINTMLENKTSTAYGYNNIVNILFNKSKEMGQSAMTMVCSQFVSYILSKADIKLADKSTNLITPKDLSNIINPKVYKVYEGYARLYEKKNIDRILRKVSKSAQIIKEYSINI